MGRKVHPYSFRFSLTKKYLSNWYSENKNYSTNIYEDFIIRNKIEDFFREYLLISKIEIFKNNSNIYEKNDITTIIHCLKPKIKDILKNIEINDNLLQIYSYYKNDLEENIKLKKNNNSYLIRKYNIFFIKMLLKYISNQFLKIFQTIIFKKLKIKFIFIKNIYQNINLIAKYLGNQLKKENISCKRLLCSIIEKYKSNIMYVSGIKIKISGRHNGADKARIIKTEYGNISLHVLKLKIDYIQHYQNTMNGVFGIKIWALIQ